MENEPISQENPQEIPQETQPESEEIYDKFSDKRFIQSKPEFYAYFMLISTASFLIIYFFTNTLRDALLDAFLPDQLTVFNIMELMVVLLIVNVLWDLLLLFAIVNILNVVIARVLNIQVGRVFLATLISLILAVIIFQVAIFLWFYMGDPIGMRDRSMLDYIIELFYYGEVDLSGATTDNIFYYLVGLIGDVFLVFFYKMTYINDQSFMNYLLLYAIAKGFASNVPFEMGDLGFNPLLYEPLFEFGIYAIIFTIFFFAYIKPCICITEEMLDKQIADYESEEVFMRKEEGKELGKSVVIEKKGKTLEEWEVEK